MNDHSKRRRAGWVAGAGLALASAWAVMGLAGCEAAQAYLEAADRPTARVVDASLAGLSVEGVELLVDVEVANPYGVALPTPAFDYALSANGASVVRGSADVGGAVPANGRRVMRVPVGVVFANVLAAAEGVELGEVVDYAIDLTLSTEAPAFGAVSLPLRQTGELPVPAPPTVALSGIDVGRFSPALIEMEVGVDVTNPNAFRLALGRLDYALSLAGRDVASASVAEVPALRPGRSGSFAFPVRVRPLSLGAAFLSAMSRSSTAYRLRGSFAAESPFGPIELPVDRSGDVPLLR
ncbi:MAG: LEA type 2 family protein [Planctomycetota bacterium]